ncbi:hypothetical protein HKD37_07G018399 [Glycine soja]
MTHSARQIRSTSDIRLVRHTTCLANGETLEENKPEMCSPSAQLARPPSKDVVSSRAQWAQSHKAKIHLLSLREPLKAERSKNL